MSLGRRFQMVLKRFKPSVSTVKPENTRTKVPKHPTNFFQFPPLNFTIYAKKNLQVDICKFPPFEFYTMSKKPFKCICILTSRVTLLTQTVRILMTCTFSFQNTESKFLRRGKFISLPNSKAFKFIFFVCTK